MKISRFVTSTYVPQNDPGRHEGDVQKYNDAAKRVMEKHSVGVNNIYQQSVSLHKLYGNGTNNVHYNKQGYEEIGKLVAVYLEPLIKNFLKPTILEAEP